MLEMVLACALTLPQIKTEANLRVVEDRLGIEYKKHESRSCEIEIELERLKLIVNEKRKAT